jgi:sulfate permease, SulP family
LTSTSFDRTASAACLICVKLCVDEESIPVTLLKSNTRKLEGRVGIMVDMGRTFRARAQPGPAHDDRREMGLITGQPRSAGIEAEVDSVLYALSADSFQHFKTNDQALSQALLTYVIKVMAERLSFASRVIGVLRR